MTHASTSVRFDPMPLKRAKLIRRMKVVDLARRADCSICTISDVLNGKRSNSKALAALCEILGVPVDACFPEESSR